MKTASEIANNNKNGSSGPSADDWYEDDVVRAMNEYAIQVLEDFDNWKAHKTTDLVKLYIKEKGL